MPGRFLSIHQLIHYPGGKPLNAGEDGLPKTLTLAGTERTRISSQTAKRALRTARMERTREDGQTEPDSLADLGKRIGVKPSIRTRRIIEHALRPGFEKARIPNAPTWAASIARSFGGAETEDTDTAAQPIVLGHGDMARLADVVQTLIRQKISPEAAVTERNDRVTLHAELRKALKELRPQTQDAGLDGALFGRMATSELIERADAAVKVGHALSTGVHQVEADFFATVDDFGIDGGPGAAHINNKPLTSALFYRHSMADLGAMGAAFPSLTPDQVAAVAAWLVRALYRVGLTQRLAGDASAQVPVALILDLTAHQPYSAALAFEQPVDDRAGARAALLAELESLDKRVGKPIARLSLDDHLDKPYAAVDAVSDALQTKLESALAQH